MQEDGFRDVSFMLHCVVYALVRRGEVIYVGKTKAPMPRIWTHYKTKGREIASFTGMFDKQVLTGVKFDEVWVRPCMLRELDEIEIAMIKKYRPRYNVRHVTPGPMPPRIKEMLARMRPALPEIDRRGM